MRCFIAIDIDENIRTGIGRLQRRFKDETGLTKPDVKWVEPGLIHLTLKFLGEVKDRDINNVCGIAADVAGGREGFSIDVKNLGCFGSVAKVLWVGVEKTEALLALQKDIDNRLAQAGWPSEKREFAGHLTLCRIKKTHAGRKLGELVRNYGDLSLGSLSVDSICVYKSDLTKAGPVYTPISKSMLKHSN